MLSSGKAVTCFDRYEGDAASGICLMDCCAVEVRRTSLLSFQVTIEAFDAGERRGVARTVLLLCRLWLLACCLTVTAPAQISFQRLKSFGIANLSGAAPYAQLVEGIDGHLYGTTYQGGSNNVGTVFRIAKDGSSYLVLHSFAGSDGASTFAPLLAGSDGALYGTTPWGGILGLGVVFKLNRDGTGFQVLHHFAGVEGSDGSTPYEGLIEGNDGVLYGSTAYGGHTSADNPSGVGTVFKLNRDGSGYAVIFSANGGDVMRGRPVEGSDGFLYSPGYDTNGNGLVCRIDKQGGGFLVLGRFAGVGIGLAFEGNDGWIYGTSTGGSNGYGAVVRMQKDGSDFALLHSFERSQDDPRNQRISLIEGSDGAIYGTTYLGGTNRCGTVFRLSRDGGGYEQLVSFDQANRDGYQPHGGLIEGSDGLLYGATPRGGRHGEGTAFRLSKSGSGYNTIRSFSRNGGEGYFPESGLIAGRDGSFYGTTLNGGANRYGTIFKFDTDGTNYTELHSFTNLGGNFGAITVMEGGDGGLYGITGNGGSNRYGAVFTLQRDGSRYRLLREFAGLDGRWPVSGLIEGSDGLLYGTTRAGGWADAGTLFRISKDGGGYTVLRHFLGRGSGNNDGSDPRGELLEASDGAIYGITSRGTTSDCGSIYRINRDGNGYVVLRRFSIATGEGRWPQAGLMEGRDGMLYGTTPSGGSSEVYGNGTIFRINKDGSGFQTLHRFTGDGRNPVGKLVAGSDGTLYGTALGTTWETIGDWGVVFKLRADGTGYTVLHRFARSDRDGCNPRAGLLLTANDVLYGVASAGGDMNLGTVFRLSLRVHPRLLIRLADGRLLLQVSASFGGYCLIEASTNLVDWESIGFGTPLPTGEWEFEDAQARLYPNRFYRAVRFQ